MISKEKRNIIAIHNDEDDDLGPLEMKMEEKSASEIERIERAVESNFLFQHLNSEQKALVLNQIGNRSVKANEEVIRQGDKVYTAALVYVLIGCSH